jgi:protein TonB
MPHELLGDVLRTGDSDGRARRRRLVLPISVGVHAAAAAAILIVPLAAEVELPVPMRPAPRVFRVVAEPPPVVVPVRGVQRAPVARRAPSEAPPAIVEETPVPEQPAAGGPPGPPVIGPVGTPDGWGVEGMGQRATVVAPLPPPPAPRTPVRPGGRIREPRRIVDVAPVYPPFAIAARKEGVVILEALLDENGNVDRVKVLRSEPLLDDAAVQAVRRWRYTPTLLNGVPVPVLMTVTVRFSLR